MTLQDCIDNRRWAEELFRDVEVSIKLNWSVNKAKQYHYLKGWLVNFDRLITNFTCWPEHHIVYKDGLNRLKQLSNSL